MPNGGGGLPMQDVLSGDERFLSFLFDDGGGSLGSGTLDLPQTNSSPQNTPDAATVTNQ